MLKKKSVAKAKIFFLLIQSAPFPCPRHPPLSFNSSLLQFKNSLLIERIRGFRFSMAAGSQSVESWAKKLDRVQLGKKSIFPRISHAVQLARVSRRNVEPLGIFFQFFSIHMFFLTFYFSKPPESEVACTWAESLICK